MHGAQFGYARASVKRLGALQHARPETLVLELEVILVRQAGRQARRHDRQAHRAPPPRAAPRPPPPARARPPAGPPPRPSPAPPRRPTPPRPARPRPSARPAPRRRGEHRQDGRRRRQSTAKTRAAAPRARPPRPSAAPSRPARRPRRARPAPRRASGGSESSASVAEQLARGAIKPRDVVMLTRDRIQETLDDAASRGRVTRKDANELVAELVRRGRQQSDDLLGELEALVGTGAASSRRPPSAPARPSRSTALVRGADRARRIAGVGPSFPILGYDDLNAAQVQSRLKRAAQARAAQGPHLRAQPRQPQVGDRARSRRRSADAAAGRPARRARAATPGLDTAPARARPSWPQTHASRRRARARRAPPARRRARADDRLAGLRRRRRGADRRLRRVRRGRRPRRPRPAR